VSNLEGISIAVDARSIQLPGIGFSSYLKGAVQCLLERRARVSLLTNFPAENYYEFFPAAEWVRFGSQRDLIWDQYDLPRFLRARSFDLYWAPANNGIPFFPIGRTWKISTTHDLVPLRLPRMYLYYRPLFAFPYLIWTIASMLRSDTILTVSESSAHDIWHTFRRRATIISPVFSDLSSSTQSRLLPDDIRNRTYVVYNGGLDPRKNVHNLLAAFAIAAQTWLELSLVIVGAGYSLFDSAIEKLGISEKVILTGYVDDDTKWAILKAAAAVAYPSLYEGFGLPLLEAFAAGTPVLTSANSSLPEVAGDAAVYVDPRDPASIAKGILRLRDPELVAELRAKGTERLSRFEPAASCERLVAEILGIAQRREHRS
jgi:glycosyltransferase involved in cell wall biosynthesis